MVRRSSRRVLIAGGGVAALEAALALRALAADRVSVELLAPEPEFWYRPLAVAEPFGLGQVRHFDLAELAESTGASFLLGAVTAEHPLRPPGDCVRRGSYPGGARRDDLPRPGGYGTDSQPAR
jgi:hypothetical protein